MDDPFPPLSATELRVLGSLVEKAVTTPDYYPLTLNSLTLACNQQSNRDPVVAFDETTVVRALDGLREKRLASVFTGAESRVAKYKHNFTDALQLTPAEVGLLCVLMLRGPQTLAELRTRTERFQVHPFESLTEVEEALTALAARTPQALVVKLPRLPGTKEPRYAHLLAGPIDVAALAAPASSPPPEPATLAVRAEDDRFAKLEAETAALRTELAELRQQFADFRKQFE
jgi:uncharacterized protein YceH (UPF0502 family)